MQEKPIWIKEAQFKSGQTQFGYYDNDPDFQLDADRVAGYCASRLGFPMMDVELSPESLYTCFEQAITRYGNEIYKFLIKENFSSLEGSTPPADLNNTLLRPNLARIVNIAKNYGTEVEVGSLIPLYDGLVDLKAGQQDYDLNEWAVKEGIDDGIEIRRVYYQAPPAILRYFDPFAGTGTGIQSLMDAFDFSSHSPGVNFMLMPLAFDVAKIQAIEMSDQVRRSHYSFRLNDNQLKIFPVPRRNHKLKIEYYKISEKRNVIDGTRTEENPIVTNISNVPYRNPIYKDINSVGRQWILDYTLALAMQTLAYVRGKYQTVPIPGSEATLNQADLLTDSRELQKTLLEDLKEMLEEVTTSAQLEKKAEEGENLRKTLTGIPMKIYVR